MLMTENGIIGITNILGRVRHYGAPENFNIKIN